MRLPNMFGLLTASALLIGATSANALVLTLEELDAMDNVIASETIVDNGAFDNTGAVGAISFDGAVGNFFLNITTATGDAVIGFGDDRVSGNDLTYNSLSGMASRLRITLLEEGISIDTSPSAPTAIVLAEIDQSVITGETSVQTFISVNDTAPGDVDMGALLIAADLNRADSAGPDVTGTLSVALAPGDTFDLKTVVLLEHDKLGRSVGTVSIDVAAVPVPAALPLFLTALLGLGFIGRRRRQTA